MWGCSERVRKRRAPPHLALSFSSACPSPSSVFGNEPTVENVSPRSASFRGKLTEPKDGVAGIWGSRASAARGWWVGAQVTARAALACGVGTGLSCRTEPSRGLSCYLQETVSRRPESQDSRLGSERGGVGNPLGGTGCRIVAVK